MATIFSSETENCSNQIKTSIAAKNNTFRTYQLFFIKSKVAMTELLYQELASVQSIKWK